MEWYQALILGVIQGLTEFLPISSSGHLIIMPYFLKWPAQPLVFDLILHLGTATALIVYFKEDLRRVLKSLNKDLSKEEKSGKKYKYDSQLGLFIIIGSLPAALIGFFAEPYVESYLRSVLSVVAFLVAGSALMYLAEKKYKEREKHDNYNQLTGKRAVIIGFFQSLALLPGMSRSGSTISGGMLMGLHKEYAARFSFLMSIPIVVGAAFFKITEALDTELAVVGLEAILLGYISSFVIGYFAIDFLLKFLKKNNLFLFVVYRLVLAAFIVSVYFGIITL